MNHQHAIKIFEEIRARPYGLMEKAGMPADNCYFKSMELLRCLKKLGYSVRSRVEETFWNDDLIPRNIIALYPSQFLVAHSYVEAEIDGIFG